MFAHLLKSRSKTRCDASDMNPANRSTRRGSAASGSMLFALLLVVLACAAGPALAAPFIWDQDDNGLDDRIESVHLLGYEFSFENGDTLAPQRIQVIRTPGGLSYGIYVVFDHDPTPGDIVALTTLGIPVLHRYEGVPAVRALATFAQAQAAAGLVGVERVEAVPELDPQLHDCAAAIAARDASERVFPTWSGTGGADGAGVAVAILDTGINDAADGAYPGHESLAGRCLGGASFVNGDSLLDTPPDSSVNPVDRGGDATHSHGTHVAGIVLGSGGASGYAIGVAPGARFVDVKVLSDAGSGIGVADGLDWCIHNRGRDWGAPGYAGIQVINLSLSSPDASDGTDVVARLADRAVELGMVVVTSIGNSGRTGFAPSPAGASQALAVGAIDVQRTPEPGDDRWAAFSNSGPRPDAGITITGGQQKPDLAAPGVAVLSADGSLASDGAQYQRLSGTSMAAAFVSGVVAALRSAHPALTPDAIAVLLRSTARRGVSGTPAGPAGDDVRWNASLGWGVVDLYAAKLELEQPGRSQLTALELTPGSSSIAASLRTQRERGAARFVFERAPDVAGAPGTFAGYDSVAAAGDSSLATAVNRHAYARNWPVPAAEHGRPFWYRAAYTEAGMRYATPARRVVSPSGPPIATIELTVVHDAYDHDVTGLVSAAGPSGAVSLPLPGTSAAVSSDWVNGTSTTGSVAWTFRIDVPDGSANSLLPPSSSHPWWLRVDDAGYLNDSGRITDYRLIWHAPGGDQTFDGGPVPLPTVEGRSVFLSAPQVTAGVGPGSQAASGLHYGPNPVIAGAAVAFSLPAGSGAAIDVIDLAGRRVARIPVTATAAGGAAVWQTRDATGRALPPGLYLVRAGEPTAVRVVIVR